MVVLAVAVVVLASQVDQAHQGKDSLVVLVHRHQAQQQEQGAVAVEVVLLVLLLQITVGMVELAILQPLQDHLFLMQVEAVVAAETLAVLAVLVELAVAGMA
jgi:hypothetical protein